MAENYRRLGKHLSLSSTNAKVRGSPRNLSIVAIWNHVGKSVVQPLLFFKPLFFSSCAFLIFLLPFYYPSFFFFFSLFPLLSQCDRCPDVPVWGLIAGLQGLLAMGAFYYLGAGWSQWRPLDISGTHLTLSLMQSLMKVCFPDQVSILVRFSFFTLQALNYSSMGTRWVLMSSPTYTSLVLSNLPHASITWLTHAKPCYLVC